MVLINPYAFPVTPSGPTLVQQKTGSITDKTFQFDFDTNVTAGNAIIICISYLNTQTVSSISLGDNALAQEVLSDGTGIATAIWVLTNAVNTGTTVIFSMSDTTDVVINMSEWSGLNDTGAEDVNSGVGVLSSTVSTGSVTPVSTNNLVIGAGAWTADDYSTGPTNSFTRMTQVGSGATTFQESAYRIQTTATARSTGWGLTAGVNWAACAAVFGAP